MEQHTFIVEMLVPFLVLFLCVWIERVATQFAVHVNKCPETSEDWRERALSYICVKQREEYHCIQDINNTLIETCMKPFSIASSEGGCPWIHVYTDGTLYKGIPMHNCSTELKDCPTKNHKGYLSNQLYKYPGCVRNDGIANDGAPSVELSTTQSSEETAEECYRKYCYQYVMNSAVIAITSFLALESFVLYICNRFYGVTENGKGRYYKCCQSSRQDDVQNKGDGDNNVDNKDRFYSGKYIGRKVTSRKEDSQAV